MASPESRQFYLIRSSDHYYCVGLNDLQVSDAQLVQVGDEIHFTYGKKTYDGIVLLIEDNEDSVLAEIKKKRKESKELRRFSSLTLPDGSRKKRKAALKQRQQMKEMTNKDKEPVVPKPTKEKHIKMANKRNAVRAMAKYLSSDSDSQQESEGCESEMTDSSSSELDETKDPKSKEVAGRLADFEALKNLINQIQFESPLHSFKKTEDNMNKTQGEEGHDEETQAMEEKTAEKENKAAEEKNKAEEKKKAEAKKKAEEKKAEEKKMAGEKNKTEEKKRAEKIADEVHQQDSDEELKMDSEDEAIKAKKLAKKKAIKKAQKAEVAKEKAEVLLKKMSEKMEKAKQKAQAAALKLENIDDMSCNSSESSSDESSSDSSSESTLSKKRKRREMASSSQDSDKEPPKKTKAPVKAKRNTAIYPGQNFLHCAEDDKVEQLAPPKLQVYVKQEDLSEASDSKTAAIFIRRMIPMVYTPEAIMNATPSGFPPRGKSAAFYTGKEGAVPPRLHPDGIKAIFKKVAALEETNKLWRPKMSEKDMRATFATAYCALRAGKK